MFDLPPASSFSRSLLSQASIRKVIGAFSVLAFTAHGVHGAEVTQSRAFSVTKAGSGTGTLVVVGTEGLVGSGFAPFDPSLGTLTSFSVKWDATLTTSATVSASSTNGGGFTASIGGNFRLNSDANNGGGTGGGGGNGPGAVITSSPVVFSKLVTCPVPDSPRSYNPAWLAGVTGNSDFTLSFIGAAPNNPPVDLAKVDHTGLSSISSTLATTVTLTYNYTPPQSFVLNGASGSVPHSTNYTTDNGLILSLGFDAEYLVIGGGGSGGTGGGSAGQNTWGAGGGGAGGFLSGTMALTPKSYNVTVGAGGQAPAYNAGSTSTGKDGLSSFFDSVTALGGGGGAGGDNANGGDGRSGASGGGGGSKYANPGGSGTSPQGYAGGSARYGDTSNAGSRTAGGGGGGAGGAGNNAGPWNSVAGAGGVGRASEITGTSVTYGGGGGGGARDTNGGQQSGAGGTGGGGAGSTQSNATSGTNGLGGGGGGSGADGKGGDGGSGLVIVRYKGAPAGTGGTVSTGTGSAAGYTLHTFNTTGASALDLSGLVLNNRLGAVLSGTISGSSGLTFNGPGTLTLAGANTYAGSTTVSGGTLAVGGNSLPNSGDLIVNGGKVAATGTEVVRALYFDGGRQPLGTYGATGSGATYIDDAHFSGTAGVVQVTEGFATSTTSLSGFSTTTNLASASQSFIVTGGGITSPIVLSPPSGFEISTDGTTFSSSATLGLPAGTVQSVYRGDFTTASGKIWLLGSGHEFPNRGAFAALSNTGAVVTWGDLSSGADTSDVSGNLASGVTAIYSTERAFAAVKSNGSVITWGHSGSGGNSSSVSSRLNSGVRVVYSSQKAFAALKDDGSVITWGDASFGGNSTAVASNLSSGITTIYTNPCAFAALKADGSVITWGDSTYGGNSSSVSSNLRSGVTAVTSTEEAFAALKSNGSVVVWGNGLGGGDPTAVASKLGSNVRAIHSNQLAFAALKADGSVVTWGYNQSGGDSSAVASQLNSGVTKIYPSTNAFAALKSDGSVVTWGNANFGGDSSAVASRLTSGVTTIYSAPNSFAALKADGSVVTWGGANSGGDSSAVASQLTSGVTAIYSNNSAYAALKADGSVVTWGTGLFGGNSSAVASQLNSGVTAVYASRYAFAALKSDGSLVTWGDPMYGADSRSVYIGAATPIPATIHVRLASTSSAGPVTGNLTLTHSGSATQTVALSGTVTPPLLSPSTQTLNGTYGTAIDPTTAFTQTGLGGTATYSVSPALPAGLSLNSTTGVISGTPTAVKTVSTTYTITATGATGTSATATVTLAVSKAPLTVVAVDQSLAYGVANPTLSATFSGLVNGDTLGVISGAPSLTTTATSNSAPGTYTITASIGTLSATNYSFSNFTAGTLTIGKAAQSISIAPLASSVPLKELSRVNLSATSTSGLPVTLSLGAGSAATLSGTVGGYSLTDIGTTGIVTVLANQTGNVNYTAATQVVATFDVTKSNQTITFAALANKTYGDPAFTLTATSDSAQSVSYLIASGPATLNGSTLTLTAPGTVVVRADQAGNDSYNAAPAVGRSFTVAPKQLTVTGAVAADKVADNSDVATIIGARLVGVINGDEVTLGNASTGTFSQSAAGTDLTVTTTMTLAGADAANYTLTQPDLTATISVGLPADYLASDGTPDISYMKAHGSKLKVARYGYVSRSAFDASGRWLVAGTFTGYDGISSNSLLRLNPDGSADPTFNANMGSGLANLYDDGNVNVKSLLVRKNGQIMVGGAFTSLNGVSLPRGIACMHPDGTPDTAFNTKLNALSFRFGNEAMVEQPDGKIVGDHSSGGVCRLNPDGTLDSTFVNLSGRSWASLISRQRDGKLLVGGLFPSYGGKPVAGLVRLNADGTMDTAFNDALGTGFPRIGNYPSVTTTVIAPDGKIWVGGYFTSFNGQPVPGLVRLNPDGTLDSACQTAIGTPFTGSMYSVVTALCLQPDGKVVVGGLFDKFNNLSTSGLFRLNSDGSPDLAFSNKFGSGVDWSVSTIGIRSTGELMIGGSFSKIGSQPAKNIAQLVWSGSMVPDTQTLAATYGSAITPTSAFTTKRVTGTVSYAISPALPSGLSLNASTGVISGTPRSVVTTPKAYIITATGSTSGSATSSVTLSVAKAPLMITANPSSRAYGKSNPTFDFSIDGLANGDTTSVISGKPSYACEATSSSSPGLYPITPSLGSLSAINYSFSSFEQGSLKVEKASQTLSLAPLATSVPLKDLGSVSLSATSSAGLPVTLSLDAGSAATLSGSVGSYALTDIGQTGIVTVRASQTGNSTYSAALDVVVSFDVTKSNQAINFGSLAGKTFGDAAFDLSATADSGLPVSFSLVSGPAELQGAAITLTGAGTVVIRASQAGNDLYNEASAVIRSFAVTPAAQTITFGTLAAVTYGDVPSALSATSDSGLAVTYEVLSGPATLDGLLLAPTAAGTVVVRASQAGDDNHLAADPVERSLTVNRRVVTVIGATALDKSADESTAAQIAGAELSGVMDGDDVALVNHLSGTFSQATPGSGLVVTTAMTLEGADAGSYLLTQPTLTASITASQDNHTHQELWRFANFGSYDSVDSGADSADPDHDGLNNLLEYALGLDPNSSGVIPAVLALSGANLEYTYTRSTAAKDNGVTYQIEWSETLEAGSWSTETVTQQITSTQGALETVKASVPKGTGGKRFLRLRVGAAPLQTP
jgi:uncharacterized delta-60 repeat protein